MGFAFPGKKHRKVPGPAPESSGERAAASGSPRAAATEPAMEVPATAGPSPAGQFSETLARTIRADSAGHRLSALSALRTAHPVPQELQDEFPRGVEEAIERAEGAEDLKKMSGSSETWFFSERSMTGAYALHLLRLEERDPVRLIADTVRDDSRIYPRPTDIRFFNDPPFSMSDRDLRQALGMMELRPDCADIRRCNASNGALYLYSTLHLAENLAESLCEWIEVGQKENP